MYCHQCGTDNFKGATHCSKCGHVFGEATQGPSSLVEMSSKFKREPIEKNPQNKFLRSMAVAFAIVGLLAAPTMAVLSYGGYLDPRSGDNGNPILTKFSTQKSGSVDDTEDMSARDNERRGRADELSVTLISFAESNNRFPVSLEEIPETSMRFIPDRSIFHYQSFEEGASFSLRVTLEDRYEGDPSIETENGRAFYVIEDRIQISGVESLPPYQSSN